jgi:hypothetical protein
MTNMETGKTGINDRGINDGWSRGTTGKIETVADLVNSLLQLSQDKKVRWESEQNSGEFIGTSESSYNDYVCLYII